MNIEQYEASMDPELRAGFVQMKPFFSSLPSDPVAARKRMAELLTATSGGVAQERAGDGCKPRHPGPFRRTRRSHPHLYTNHQDRSGAWAPLYSRRWVHARRP